MGPITNEEKAYLLEDRYVDYRHPLVRETAERLAEGAGDRIELAERLYRFVRDAVKHAWDVQDPRIAISASEVLREGVGICYGKANLLAALLRYHGIPAGFCYQRLTLGDTPESGYCVHALNAVCLDGRWVRLDARGNKAGIQAEFSPDRERLAFQIRPAYGEIDYQGIYCRPAPETMAALEAGGDMLSLYLHGLPEALDTDRESEAEKLPKGTEMHQ